MSEQPVQNLRRIRAASVKLPKCLNTLARKNLLRSVEEAKASWQPDFRAIWRERNWCDRPHSPIPGQNRRRAIFKGDEIDIVEINEVGGFRQGRRASPNPTVNLSRGGYETERCDFRHSNLVEMELRLHDNSDVLIAGGTPVQLIRPGHALHCRLNAHATLHTLKH